MSGRIGGSRMCTTATDRRRPGGRPGTGRAADVSAATSAKVLERFPAGAPRGSWPAEEYAARRRAEGEPATVVMDLESDAFLVVVPSDDD
ncbi:predicted protein [Streptomyces viridochromogenes DSM 40736]|uniref:Predicted protein n=1 Tax=Streptomyces viridochromogenes (strain DSM 40736 / JCM 4977 / BCRC 1201 / Tue 494) TaxID=591159 RepID=D9X6B8_STRVT|nr:predicted protein [Streptomyces viridochromogenes DSM 40736]